MAKCAECGASIGLLNSYGPKNTLCGKCFEEGKVGKAKLELDRTTNAAIEAVMLTTESYPQGLNITKRIEVVTAECAFGMNIFKDLFAGVRDIVGGRSKAVQDTLRDSRRTTLFELKKEAFSVGANAVVGVDLDYVELSASGSMVLLVASGTAVVIED